MVYLGGAAASVEEARATWKDPGRQRATASCVEMVDRQGGRAEDLERIAEINPARLQVEIRADRAGYIQGLRTDEIGRIVMRLGAGREEPENPLTMPWESSCGTNRRPVEIGDTLAVIYANDRQRLEGPKARRRCIPGVRNRRHRHR